MAITTFNTGANGSSSKGGNTALIVIAALAVGGFLYYRFVYKPQEDAKKKELEDKLGVG